MIDPVRRLLAVVARAPGGGASRSPRSPVSKTALRFAAALVAFGIIAFSVLVAPAAARATGSNVAPSARIANTPTATSVNDQQQGDPTQTATTAPTKTPTARILGSATVTTTPTQTATTAPTKTPTATVLGSATATSTPTRTSTVAPPSTAAVVINANLYGSLDPTKLRRGDVFKSQAVRAGAAETPLPRSVFLRAVNNLATVPTGDVQQYGLVKEIVLSSIQDLQTYLPDFPADVTAVEYDFEGGMTPQVEYGDPVGSASQFAQIARASGKTVTFTPIASMLRKLISNGGIAQIGPLADAVGYQGQKQYLSLGESAFLAQVQSNSAAIRGVGSRFRMQLGFGWEDCPTTVRLFTQAGTWLDYDAIGTHSDATYAACVLAGLRP